MHVILCVILRLSGNAMTWPLRSWRTLIKKVAKIKACQFSWKWGHKHELCTLPQTSRLCILVVHEGIASLRTETLSYNPKRSKPTECGSSKFRSDVSMAHSVSHVSFLSYSDKTTPTNLRAMSRVIAQIWGMRVGFTVERSPITSNRVEKE